MYSYLFISFILMKKGEENR